MKFHAKCTYLPTSSIVSTNNLNVSYLILIVSHAALATIKIQIGPFVGFLNNLVTY